MGCPERDFFGQIGSPSGPGWQQLSPSTAGRAVARGRVAVVRLPPCPPVLDGVEREHREPDVACWGLGAPRVPPLHQGLGGGDPPPAPLPLLLMVLGPGASPLRGRILFGSQFPAVVGKKRENVQLQPAPGLNVSLPGFVSLLFPPSLAFCAPLKSPVRAGGGFGVPQPPSDPFGVCSGSPPAPPRLGKGPKWRISSLGYPGNLRAAPRDLGRGDLGCRGGHARLPPLHTWCCGTGAFWGSHF